MSQAISAHDMTSLVSTILSSPDFVRLIADKVQSAVAPIDKIGGEEQLKGGEEAQVFHETLSISGGDEDNVCSGASGTGSATSWADECNEEESVSSVEFKAPKLRVSDDVKRSVKFGGLADVYDGVGVKSASDISGAEPGFLRTYVKTVAVNGLKKFVEEKSGGKIPKAVMIHFALCAYSSATMPSGFHEGKKRLKQLEAIGDAAITLHVAMSKVAMGHDVDSAQSVRSRMTSNAYMSRLAYNSGLMSHVSTAQGLSLDTAKTSANALEAIVGFLVMYREVTHVKTFLHSMQLV